MTGAGNATATMAGRCARSSPALYPPAAAPPSARDSAARRAQVKASSPAGLITSVPGVGVGGDEGTGHGLEHGSALHGSGQPQTQSQRAL